MKKKVCILQNGLTLGGTDTFVINLCKGIDKTKFDVTIVMPCPNKPLNSREKEMIAMGVNFQYTSPFYGLKGKLLHLIRLYKILREGKYDVFQTNVDLFNGLNLLIALLAGVPVRCCHSHNGMRQKSIVSKETLFDKIYIGVSRWLCWHCANRHCGCSDLANDFLYKGHNWRDSDYPNVILNGINLMSFKTPINIKQKKEELGLNNKYNILTVGRIIPQKNPLFISKIISMVLQTRDDVDFVWVSDGPLKGDCEKIFIENEVLDRIHFLGFRNDVADIMKCCDLFFMPSVFEGLPLVLVEAQASGMKCLISDNITKMVNCGLIKYADLSGSDELWVGLINNLLNGDITLNIDNKALSKFAFERMASDMQIVFS